ncbi:MAG: alpha/beta hydrolase [Chloroflexi bacterium]|nr:alpha/beta hydrolase [Chloroflexota bacterium]
MKKKFLVLSIISAIGSIFPFLKSKNRTITTLLWLPKLLSGAFSLWLAMFGVISSIYGWMRHDRKLTFTGGLGAFLSLTYIRQVTKGHDGFAKTFGQDWQDKIPPAQVPRLQRVRWPILSVPVQPVPHQKDITYGTSPATGQPLLADLWVPPKHSLSSGLGIIYIHGGSWQVGTRDLGTGPFFQRLATLGHVVMDIEYTLYPLCTMVEMTQEVKLAIAWLKAHSSILGVNPQRIVLIGGSAGAHLALLAGYTPDNAQLRPTGISGDLSVRGVVAFYPPTDFRNLPGDYSTLLDLHEASQWKKDIQETVIHFMNDSLRIASSLRGAKNQIRRPRSDAGLFVEAADFIFKLIGGTPDENPELFSLVSPAAHVNADCPPTLLLQGTDDFFNFLPGVQRLYKSLQAAGVPSILVEFPHCEHAFDLILPQISPAAQAATHDVERFLAIMSS